MTRPLCQHCRTYPVRAFQKAAKYCSIACRMAAYRLRKGIVKKSRHGRPTDDFTPAQIEARYERARLAKRRKAALQPPVEVDQVRVDVVQACALGLQSQRHCQTTAERLH